MQILNLIKHWEDKTDSVLSW